MNRQVLNRAFAVGLLVAVCGVAFLIAFTFFRKGGYSEKDTYVVFSYFEDATGLTWKSRLQIAGIQVGEVEKITLAGHRARLDMRVRKDIDLRTDACVTKRFPSALLPDALLDATPGRAPRSLRDLPPEEREVKCVIEGTTVAKLLDSMSKIADNVQDVTRELSGMVSGSQGSIKNIISNLERITTRIDETVENGSGNIAAILQNAADFTGTLSQVAQADRERYRAIARNIESASARLDQLLASAQDLLGKEGGEQQGQIKSAVQDARESLSHLNKSLAEVEKVTTKIGEGKGVAGKLLNDERLGEKFSTAVEGVSDYVDRLTKLQIEVQLRSEWLLNQNGAKTYAGFKIIPRPDKYYLIQVVNDPRGINNVVTNKTVTQTGTGTFTTNTTTTTNEQRVAFSVEFAKRFGPATFRIGLIENSGGAGADLHLLDDSLKLSVDVYQFARPENVGLPRAKIWLDYTFLRYFYVTTGADDFLNRWRAGRFPGGPKFAIGNDVFFGGGLMFTDDDLKTLFGVAGGSAGTAASSASK